MMNDAKLHDLSLNIMKSILNEKIAIKISL